MKKKEQEYTPLFSGDQPDLPPKEADDQTAEARPLDKYPDVAIILLRQRSRACASLICGVAVWAVMVFLRLFFLNVDFGYALKAMAMTDLALLIMGGVLSLRLYDTMHTRQHIVFMLLSCLIPPVAIFYTVKFMHDTAAFLRENFSPRIHGNMGYHPKLAR